MRAVFEQESDFRRERDFGQKISATFEFIGGHWRGLGRVMLYLVLPAVLLQGIVSVLLQLQMGNTVQGALRNQTPGLGGIMRMQGSLLGSLSGSPIYWLGILLGNALFTLVVLSVYGYVVVLLHRRTPGPEVTVAEVWAVVRNEFLGVFFSSWGVFLAIGIGFFLLAVPGIYLSVALSLFFIVKVAEGTGFGAAFSRCISLTKGKWWSTFGVIFIMMVLVYMVLIGIGTAVSLFSGGLVFMLHASREQSPLFTIIVTCFSSVLMLLIYPPLLLVLAFQYFNLVERKDGLGLRRMVDSLGQTPAPQVHNATYQPDEEGEY